MQLTGRLDRLPGRFRARAGRGRPPHAVTGLVEHFGEDAVVGWVAVDPTTPPVQVTLHLGSLRVAATYATIGRRGKPRGRWKALRIPEVTSRRRNAHVEIRTFAFKLRDLWKFANRGTPVSVRVDGRHLPIFGRGMFVPAPRSGESSPRELRSLMAAGHVFSKQGVLQLSLKQDVKWQRSVHDHYDRMRQTLARTHGYEPFGIYGTLLGAVRENGYIGHDTDFDTSYLSRQTSPGDVASELVEIALSFVDAGYIVSANPRHLHVIDPGDGETRIDLFPIYFDDHGRLAFPFGMAGRRVVRRDEWRGLEEFALPGGTILVPASATEVLEQLYGDDWRQPKPGFSWSLDRTAMAKEARLTPVQQSTVYWADFYSRTEYTSGSSFFEFLAGRPDTPRRVLDIGCGDGRDACAFGQSGRQVLGLDRSHVGVAHAAEHAAALKLSESVRFEVCDVSDRNHLREVLAGHRDWAGSDATLYYLRFFLHSIPASVQEGLLAGIAEVARPGDVIAAEFRTVADEAQTKVHTRHYRRFQSGTALADQLETRHGFTVLHQEEGTGLSPYRGEDPVLCRIVARR